MRGEEGLSTHNLAPQANQDGTHNHAQDRNGDTGDNTDQHGQDDVRGELAEEQSPAVLVTVVVRHLAGVLTVVAVVTTVSSLVAEHACAALHLHLGELSGDDRAPLAQDRRALLSVARWVRGVLRGGLLNLGNHKLVLGRLDQVDADIGKTIDKDGADLDDLEVDNNEVENLVSGLSGLNLETESKLLLDGLGLLVVGSELVVALESFCVLFVILVVLVVVLLVLVLSDLRSHENIAERIRVGVKLKAVDHETGLVDGEVEFEVAGVLLVVLLWLAMVVLEDGRTSSALNIHCLGLGLFLGIPYGVDGGNGLDYFNIGLAQLGRKEEGVGGGSQAGRGDEWSQQHDEDVIRTVH